ncbi:MAG: GAF domain-containing protein, partial [Methylococcales bacterium]|nr:GAF domain-containing protein [Methylococcales bacterium]
MKVEKINKIIVENSWYKDLYEYRILKQTIFFIVIWAILCFYLIINAYTNEAFIISIILSIFAFSTFILMLHSLRKYVINPAHELYEMVVDVRQGKRAEIYQSPEDNLFSKLIQEFNQLGNEYAQITIDIDSHVQKQTARLAQKNASLKILYDVAASINQADDLDELLKRFLRILKEMTDAQAATVRLLFDDNTMHLVSCIGIDNEIITSLPSQPLDSQQLKTMISAGYLCQNNPDNSFENIGKHIHNIESLELISVPLQYHGKILGIYNLFVSKDGLSKREDIIELLISIGRHLGMAIEDFHLDNESQRLSLHEERTHLANEIHDSLAQTIASLRFQIRILSEMLQQEQYQDSANAVEKIKNSIDEAN